MNEPPMFYDTKSSESESANEREPDETSELSEPIQSFNELQLAAKHVETPEQTETDDWLKKDKHFFILSNSGKPIWTRYGDESQLSSMMGVIQAIISFFQDNDDTINTGESDTQLRDQLSYLHNQILSVLTSTQLTKIFEQRVNFDLRRLLGGTEIFLDSLSNLFSTDHSFMLSALQCLRVSKSVRDTMGSILTEGKVKNSLYAIVVSKGRLVTLLRPRKHSLHPSDLHLLFNMLNGSNTFHSAEAWTPLCLPKFNAKGFLHAYICYIEKETSIVVISTDKSNFFEISEWKTTVVERIRQENLLENIQQEGYTVKDVGVPYLSHFVYKSKMQVQFTTPELTDEYNQDKARLRLYRLYQRNTPLKAILSRQ
ncbi:vacuolar fusion protein MON1 [Sporodiniella umbellata]|nr:vacuolar fusion protein MON1 [Sporodiniella umbellata]